MGKQPSFPAAESGDEGITFGRVVIHKSTMATGTKVNRMTEAKPITQSLKTFANVLLTDESKCGDVGNTFTTCKTQETVLFFF